MGKSSAGEKGGLPEKLAEYLVGRLRRHVLWDSLLLLFPPLLVFCLLMVFLYQSAWVARGAVIFAGAAVMGAALLVGYFRLYLATPSLRAAAHLIDERVGGKDRFITLATIQPSAFPPFLLDRVRHEAAALSLRLDLEKDFPYRVKRSFFQSWIGSLSVFLLVLLYQQIGPISAPPAPRADELPLLAQKLSQIPRFSELARSLEALAARMRDPSLSSAEKRSLIQEALRRAEDQLTAEHQTGGAAGEQLNQAANALRGLEQEMEKGQERGAGGLKDDLSGAGKGSGKESGQASGEKGQGDLSGLEMKEQKGGEPERGEKQAAGKKLADKSQGEGERAGKEREKSGEEKGLGKEEVGGKGSKKMGEEIPRGKAAERFLRPGEQGEKGIKGARFVTVELPESEAQSSGGEGGSGKRREIRPKVPIGNVPLQRPDSPDAPPEKQPMPLEYRGLIR